MRKVAVLLTSIPQSGGEHQYLMLVMETIAKYDKKKFEVLAICCNRFWIRWCRERKIKCVRYELERYSLALMRINARFPKIMRIYNMYFLNLGKIIALNKVDLLIGGQQSIFLPALPCRTMQPVHDLMHRYESEFEEIKSTYKEREVLFSCESKIVDMVLVDSLLGRKQYIDCYYQKGKHIPHIGILPFAAPDYNEKILEYVETPDKYIFYPAQFWSHKNHRNLIFAIKLLKERIPDIHLILVGSERNALQSITELIESNQLENNVTILGFVSNGQIIYLYKNAVALVMPTYLGPTNIPPLEAMELGCPVIVSNVYSIPDQVGKAGLLFNPDLPEDIAKCIEKVWTDEKLRQGMIDKGYEQVKRWTTVDFKKRFLKLVLDELNRQIRHRGIS